MTGVSEAKVFLRWWLLSGLPRRRPETRATRAWGLPGRLLPREERRAESGTYVSPVGKGQVRLSEPHPRLRVEQLFQDNIGRPRIAFMPAVFHQPITQSII